MSNQSINLLHDSSAPDNGVVFFEKSKKSYTIADLRKIGEISKFEPSNAKEREIRDLAGERPSPTCIVTWDSVKESATLEYDSKSDQLELMVLLDSSGDHENSGGDQNIELERIRQLGSTQALHEALAQFASLNDLINEYVLRVEALADAAEIAVNQVQDIRLAWLESGPEVHWSNLATMVAFTMLLELNPIAAAGLLCAGKIWVGLNKSSAAKNFRRLAKPLFDKVTQRAGDPIAKNFWEVMASKGQEDFVNNAGKIANEYAKNIYERVAKPVDVLTKGAVKAAETLGKNAGAPRQTANKVTPDSSEPSGADTIFSTDSIGVSILRWTHYLRSEVRTLQANLGVLSSNVTFGLISGNENATDILILIAYLRRDLEVVEEGLAKVDALGNSTLYAFRRNLSLSLEKIIWASLYADQLDIVNNVGHWNFQAELDPTILYDTPTRQVNGSPRLLRYLGGRLLDSKGHLYYRKGVHDDWDVRLVDDLKKVKADLEKLAASNTDLQFTDLAALMYWRHTDAPN